MAIYRVPIEWLYCKIHGWFTRPFANQRAYAGYCPICSVICVVRTQMSYIPRRVKR